MLTKEEIKIMDLFRKDLLKGYTIREIMKKISKRSYHWTFDVIKKMSRMGIINIQKKGYYNICSINFDNTLTLAYLSFLDEIEANSRKLPKDDISKLINSIPLSYFTFMVAGSYAAGKATKKSDLDVVVLVEDGTETKKILAILKNKGELMIPEVHPYVFTKTEFLKMLLNDEENYGKFVFKNRVILFG